MLIFQKLIGTDKNKQKSVSMYHESAKHENRTRNPYYFGSTVLGIIKNRVGNSPNRGFAEA